MDNLLRVSADKWIYLDNITKFFKITNYSLELLRRPLLAANAVPTPAPQTLMDTVVIQHVEQNDPAEGERISGGGMTAGLL